MTIKQYLKDKKILNPDYDCLLVKQLNGEETDLVQVVNEFLIEYKDEIEIDSKFHPTLMGRK
jgi:hypothetical protein